MAMTINPAQRTQWGWDQESALFAELDAIALNDPNIATRDRHLPPTVLALLVETAKNPRDLLDQALKLREEDDWKEYRHWHSRLRKAWAEGKHDADAEADVHRVTVEITKRLAQRQRTHKTIEISQKEVAIKRKISVTLGPLTIEAEHLEQLQLPDPLRNWFVDTFRMRGHRKLLMRMSLAQHSYDNLALGLRNVWEGRNP
jgi:hypothetical protein